MAPVADECDVEDDAGDDDDATAANSGEMPNFADILGPECVIRRVDKDRNVIAAAKPEEMQRELMTRAHAQKRIGACADYVKTMSRVEKFKWAIDLKDQANELYASNNFEEAARLYNDCLVALDLDGSEEESAEVRAKLQLPICTNLAACMIEMGSYSRCVEICNLALAVEPECPKALYRRGLCRYRVGNHAGARPDFEAAYRSLLARKEAVVGQDAELKGLDDLERRISVYLAHIRRFSERERAACQKMFDRPLYADRPDAPLHDEEDEIPIDDSDEALDAALGRHKSQWGCCCCSRRHRTEPQEVQEKEKQS